MMEVSTVVEYSWAVQILKNFPKSLKQLAVDKALYIKALTEYPDGAATFLCELLHWIQTTDVDSLNASALLIIQVFCSQSPINAQLTVLQRVDEMLNAIEIVDNKFNFPLDDFVQYSQVVHYIGTAAMFLTATCHLHDNEEIFSLSLKLSNFLRIQGSSVSNRVRSHSFHVARCLQHFGKNVAKGSSQIFTKTKSLMENAYSAVISRVDAPSLALGQGQGISFDLVVSPCVIADLCCLSEGLVKYLDLHEESAFLLIVQNGLCHEESSVRKQSMFCLSSLISPWLSSEQLSHLHSGELQWKCPLFFGSGGSKEDLQEAWSTYILLLDLMFESQSHVILPGLHKMDAITKAVKEGLFHPSWLLVLLVRLSMMENRPLRRWALLYTLRFQIKPSILETDLEPFFLRFCVKMLQEQSLYLRIVEDPIEGNSEISDHLHGFVASCLDCFGCSESKERFMESLLEVISSKSWSFVPLFCITKGLAAVQSGVTLGRQTFLHIRTLVTKHFLGDPILQRATHFFLLKFVVNNIERSALDLGDIVSFLKLADSSVIFGRNQPFKVVFSNWCFPGDIERESDAENEISDDLIEVTDALLNLCFDEKYFTVKHGSCRARAALLGVLCTRSPAAFRRCLSVLGSFLEDAQCRPYMDERKAYTCLGVLSELRHHLDFHDFREAMRGLSTNSLLFLSRRVASQSVQADVYWIYARLLELSMELQVDPEVISNLFGMKNSPIDTEEFQVNFSSVQWHIIGSLASWCIQHGCHGDGYTSELRRTVLQLISKLQLIQSLPAPAHGHRSSGDGRVGSLVMKSQWLLRQFYTTVHCNPTPDWTPSAECVTVSNWLEEAEAALATMSGETIEPVFASLTSLLPVLRDTTVLKTFLDSCWNGCEERTKTRTYQGEITAFFKMAFTWDLLIQQEMRIYFNEFISEAVIIGETRFDVTNALASTFYPVLRNHPDLLLMYTPALVRLVKYGPIHHKMLRITLDMYCHLDTLPEVQQVCIEPSEPGVGWKRQIWQITMNTANFLSNLTDSSEHTEFAHEFIRVLFDEYQELLKIKSFKNFPNSLIHRERHRILSALLLLRRFFVKDMCPVAIETLLKVFPLELQASVRYQLQWLLALILHDNEEHVLPFLRRIYDNDMVLTKRQVLVCSLMSVTALLLSTINRSLLKEAVTIVTPRLMSLCMSHKFHSRIHAHMVLLKLWTLGEQQSLELHSMFPLLKHMVDGIGRQEGGMTGKRLLNNFIFTEFHPIRDFCIETIYHRLPCLTQLAPDELITKQYIHPWASESVPLCNPNSTLTKAAAEVWDIKVKESDQMAESIAEGDLQRKISSWRSVGPSLSNMEDWGRLPASLSNPSHQLVILASLIDKLPNLGGLCRSCEVFGVSELALSSTTLLDDPQLQSLSVSSHSWINVTQVPIPAIQDYLLEKKEDGFSLVGVEQTAQSQCLSEFKFPQKTLLVLGNERKGIPSDLLQFMDCCIEIPQQGVTRSLNVHVTGALVMWEYSRQQLLAEASNKNGV